MALSKAMIEAIKKSNRENDIKYVIELLETYKPHTQITQSYLVIKLLKNQEWITFIKNRNDLESFKKDRQIMNANNKKIVNVSKSDIDYIINNQTKDVKHEFLYVLLNTGRRYSEILENEFEVKNGRLYFELSKKKTHQLYEIFLLDENINKTIKYIQNIRISFKPSNSQTLTRILKKLNKEFVTHTLRAIYIKFINRFYNPDQKLFGFLVPKYLNHDADNTAHYDYINLEDFKINPFNNKISSSKEELSKLNIQKLRIIAKKINKTGYSRLKKNDLIELILS